MLYHGYLSVICNMRGSPTFRALLIAGATLVPFFISNTDLKPVKLTLPGAFASSPGPANGPRTSRTAFGDHWVTSWAASSQGPYPSGYAGAQPDLRLVFPDPNEGARDQSFRMIVHPDVWGTETRVRFSNAFGTRPVTFDGVYIGLQTESSEIAPGTNKNVTFGAAEKVTVTPGATVWSDPIRLDYVREHRAFLQGQKLAVSFHVAGSSGPMTWHAKALTTSYVTASGAGSKGALEDEDVFPFSVTSWFFVDALDMKMPQETTAIVAFGDSITDGDGATLNAEDRWTDVLSRRLHRRYGGDRFSVVNAGIAGNQIAAPFNYSSAGPAPGGPSAIARLSRDVLSLSGVSAVIWLEGTNDLSSRNFSSMEAVTSRVREAVGLIRSRLPEARVIGATVTSARGSFDAAYGSAEHESRRHAFNNYLRSSDLFDLIIDFDGATSDPASGELRPELVFNTAAGGPGDKLHPNHLGYLAMGAAAETDLMKVAADSAWDNGRRFPAPAHSLYQPSHVIAWKD